MTIHRLSVALILMVLSVPALAGMPKLTNLLPLAGQRGQEINVTFYGERLHDVSGVLFHTEGISAKEFANHEKDKTKRVVATLVIAPDAPLGEHQVRLVTKTGVSEMISFHVVDRPIINEQRDIPIKDGKRFKPSTSFDEPQAIELGSIVLGRTEAEDVDYFSVNLNKGQQFTAEVHGMRLGRGFTDSHLAVYDNERNQIAECDDTTLLKQDPYVSFIAPKDGAYTITLRDSGYQGSSNNWYMLHVGSYIRPALVYPLGGQPGTQIKLRMIGDAGGDFSQDVKLPDQPDNGFVVIPQYNGKQAPSGLGFRVNHLKNVMEDPKTANNSLNDPLPVHDVPVAFNGVLEKPGDLDYFKVKLSKGQEVTFRCFANSMGSPLDSVMNVYNAADKKHLQGNDDQGGIDSVITLKAPADGEYFVRVRDHRSRGGGDFVYRIEATVAQPTLTTAITRYDRNRPQDRQAIAVPKGNRIATLVTVTRSRVGGDLTPAIDGLPAGVTFKGIGPKEQGNLMPVVFEAAGDAPLGANLVDLQAVGKSSKKDSAEQIRGGFSQQTPLVMANPNRTEYYHTRLNTVPVAVTEAIPFKIDIVQPKAPLVHGGKQHLQIKLTRKEGYDEQVRLYMLYRPPGMGGAGRVDLNKGSSEGIYEIDANNGVPLRDWPMVIVGNGNQSGGAVWASSQLFQIKVEAPFVTGSIASAKCVQGNSVDIEVAIEHPREWQGEGELKLLGLPAAATTEPIKIKPGQDKAKFHVKVAENTPRGNHKTLMCELTIMVNGEPVIHRFGQGGRLRVDRPDEKNLAQARSDSGK